MVTESEWHDIGLQASEVLQEILGELKAIRETLERIEGGMPEK